LLPEISSTSSISARASEKEEQYRLTQEALADVDAGLVVDHQVVAAWAEALAKHKKAPASRRR